MKIVQYAVEVGFDLAVLEGSADADRLALELNGLFHDMVKAWVKDIDAMASSTQTTVTGWENAQ